MYQKLAIVILLSFTVLSCNSEQGKQVSSEKDEPKSSKVNLNSLKLDISEPVIIDSSVYVMYPLVLEADDDEDRIYSKSGGSTSYWNILFYNTASGEYHLLDETRKMIIHSYMSDNSNGSSVKEIDYRHSGLSQVDKLLYYTVTTTDYNNDAKINSEDPTYLFISDDSGKKFKQISPNGMNVDSWKIMSGTNIVLLKVTKDSNNDKAFNEKDEVVPMVYNLEENKVSSEIFSEDFKLKLKEQLQKQWLEKN